MNEAKLFDYLKQTYFPDLIRADNQYSRWDCYSDQYKTRIELKSRNTHYSSLMIEIDKYTELMAHYTIFNNIPLYINSTPKGVFVFDLRWIEPQWQTDSRMPKTTEFENTERIEKTYGMLDISLAKKI
jgi:hypothetical protein